VIQDYPSEVAADIVDNLRNHEQIFLLSHLSGSPKRLKTFLSISQLLVLIKCRFTDNSIFVVLPSIKNQDNCGSR